MTRRDLEADEQWREDHWQDLRDAASEAAAEGPGEDDPRTYIY